MLGEVNAGSEDGWMEGWMEVGRCRLRRRSALYSPGSHYPLHLLCLMFWFRLM